MPDAGIDVAAALAAIDRCWNIEWRRDPTRLGSQAALMREYLRRSAVVAESVGETPNWPWFDVAARLTLPGVDKRYLPAYVFLDAEPQYEGPSVDPLEDRIIALNRHMNESAGEQGWSGRKVCWWHIRWAAVKTHPALTALDLPDLYEPLIAFFERGGWFKPEQGYLDLDGANVTLYGWRRAAQEPPLPSLDPAALNTLDDNGKIGQ